ncbi:MAG: hypothetical protein ACE5GU_13345 [Candidatus Scalinduaceae bacterium]
MNRTIVGITGIAVTWLLITYYMYYRSTRLKVTKPVESEQKVQVEHTYKHVLSLSEQETYEELTNKQTLTQYESKLLELLNEKLVWIVKDFHDTEDEIKQKLEEERVNIKIIGWKVRRVDEQTCLVSCTYEKGGKTFGWFFDVKSGGEIIRDVSSDQELMREYNVDYREEVQKKLSEKKDLKHTMSKLEQYRKHRGKATRKKGIEGEKRILMLKQN